MATMNTPILITGCQRSGTTLIRLILNSHPNILSIDEDRFDYPSINTYLNAQWLPPFVCFKLPQYAPILQFLGSTPNIKILWCIRDPLDTVLSMLRLEMPIDNKHTTPWAAHPNGAQAEIINSIWSLNEKKQQLLSGHMNKFLEISNKKPLERSRQENIFVGALCWTIKNSLPERYKEENIGFHTVSYEKLVTSPKQTIKSILDYIGLDWSDDVLKHHEKHNGKSIGNTSNTRSIDSRGVGQGTQNFTQEETDQIKTLCSIVTTYT